MSNKYFPRGSEWRKWDLHVHTPNSHLNNKYNCTFKDVADKIKLEQLAVVGVTNYFIIEETEISELQKELGENVLLIPNFEFRTSDKNKDGEFINIHVLFNPDTVTLSKVYECLASDYSAQSVPLIPEQSVPLKSIDRGQVRYYFFYVFLRSRLLIPVYGHRLPICP